MAHTRTGVQSTIREQMRNELHNAGDMTSFDPADFDLPINRLGIKLKQAALAEDEIETEQRTIDGEIVVRRVNLRPLVKALPGMPETQRLISDVLHSMTPWPDDAHRLLKMNALRIAAQQLTASGY